MISLQPHSKISLKYGTFSLWISLTVTLLFQRTMVMESSEFGLNDVNDEEMLAAVLEMSRHEAGLPLEEEPSSSPDTGFGDTEPTQDLVYHTDIMDTDTRPPTGVVGET